MDDRIYNDYMTESERFSLADELYESYEMDRLMFMIEMVDRQLDINMRKAELKVLQESGTYEDLEYLYEEAEAQAQEQKKGIIQSIVGAITGAFQSIINGIRKFFKLNNDPNKMVEVDQQAWEAGQKLGAEWDKVSGQIDGDPEDENHWKTVVPKLLAGVAGVAGVIIGGKYVGKKIKVRAEDQEKQGDKITAICQKIVEISNKFTDSKFFNFVRKPFDELKKAINTILSKIGINIGNSKENAENNKTTGKSFSPDNNKDEESDEAKGDDDYQNYKKNKRKQDRDNRMSAAMLNGTVFDQGKAAKNARSIITKNQKILPFIKNGAVNQNGIIDAIKSGQLNSKDIKELFQEPMVKNDSAINHSDGLNFKIDEGQLTPQTLDKLINRNRTENFNEKYLKYLCTLSQRLRERGQM